LSAAKTQRTQRKTQENKTREIFALFAPLRQKLMNQKLLSAGVRFVLPGVAIPRAVILRGNACVSCRAVASPPAVLFLLSEATAA
jgi:hypothetical protein